MYERISNFKRKINPKWPNKGISGYELKKLPNKLVINTGFSATECTKTHYTVL